MPADKLTVVDGVVSVSGDAAKKISYGQLIGGKKFNTKITATGTGWDMKVAPEVKAKDPRITRSSANRLNDSRSRPKSPASMTTFRTCVSRACCTAASCARR